MQLVIVRHGETEANVGRVIQGHSGNNLSERGRQQAQCLAERLRHETIDYVYCSDLLRAKQTAEILANVVRAPIEHTALLRERCYGVFEGRSATEYEHALVTSGLPRHSYQPSHGESLLNLETRIVQFLELLTQKQQVSTVLIVAHAGTNRMLLKILCEYSYDDWLSLEQDNACFNRIKFPLRDSIGASLINCTSHLEAVGLSRMGVYE